MYRTKTYHSLVFGDVMYLYYYFVECPQGMHVLYIVCIYFNSLLELYIVLIKLCVTVTPESIRGTLPITIRTLPRPGRGGGGGGQTSITIRTPPTPSLPAHPPPPPTKRTHLQ